MSEMINFADLISVLDPQTLRLAANAVYCLMRAVAVTSASINGLSLPTGTPQTHGRRHQACTGIARVSSHRGGCASNLEQQLCSQGTAYPCMVLLITAHQHGCPQSDASYLSRLDTSVLQPCRTSSCFVYFGNLFHGIAVLLIGNRDLS